MRGRQRRGYPDSSAIERSSSRPGKFTTTACASFLRVSCLVKLSLSLFFCLLHLFCILLVVGQFLVDKFWDGFPPVFGFFCKKNKLLSRLYLLLTFVQLFETRVEFPVFDRAPGFDDAQFNSFVVFLLNFVAFLLERRRLRSQELHSLEFYYLQVMGFVGHFFQLTLHLTHFRVHDCR